MYSQTVGRRSLCCQTSHALVTASASNDTPYRNSVEMPILYSKVARLPCKKSTVVAKPFSKMSPCGLYQYYGWMDFLIERLSTQLLMRGKKMFGNLSKRGSMCSTFVDTTQLYQILLKQKVA